MMRVPGSSTSLAAQKAAGRDIRIVYSPLDALDIAKHNPDRPVIFMGVGFETTTPTIAAAILEADARGLQNFSVYCAHKTTPPRCARLPTTPRPLSTALSCRATSPPSQAWYPLAFWSMSLGPQAWSRDLSRSIFCRVSACWCRWSLRGGPRSTTRTVAASTWTATPWARQLVEQVFEPCDTTWRGLGPIAASGLSIRPEFSRFDAGARYDVPVEPTVEPRGCRCGDVLRGAIAPSDCPLFGHACTPGHPVGPCMVSSEGSCAAHYRYHD